MGLKTRIAALGIFGIPVLILWLFGGIIGCVIAITREDALSAVASLLVPAFGAIYTVVMIFKGIF